MGDLPKQLRDVAVYLAPLGSHSGATRWEAAELMRKAADALAAQQDGVEAGFSLERLWRAIEDNTQGDGFWLGHILLSEIKKETGYDGSRAAS